MASAAHRIALVTGSNQGIGKEIVRGLVQHNFHVIATSRNVEAGQATIDELRRETGKPSSIDYHQLDITDSESVKAAAHYVEGKHGKLDALINNAGIAFKGDIFGASEAKTTLDTNLRGTINVTEAFLPLLRKSDDARIVNVCSQAGRLGQVSAELQSRFQNPAATKEDITALADEFVAAIEKGDYKEKGWPKSMYGVSKLTEIAYTFLLARDLAKEKLNVSACCPGYCSTNMSSYRGHKTPAEGADTPVWLATRDLKAAHDEAAGTGGLWVERKLHAW